MKRHLIVVYCRRILVRKKIHYLLGHQVSRKILGSTRSKSSRNNRNILSARKIMVAKISSWTWENFISKNMQFLMLKQALFFSSRDWHLFKFMHFLIWWTIWVDLGKSKEEQCIQQLTNSNHMVEVSIWTIWKCSVIHTKKDTQYQPFFQYNQIIFPSEILKINLMSLISYTNKVIFFLIYFMYFFRNRSNFSCGSY